MSNDMPNIDISGIELLREVKAEQDVVKERLEKMIAMKDKVTQAVYDKVFGEYSTKLDEITDKAEPLKVQLRGQYQVLRGLLARLQEELHAIELEKEELEFRFTLGEFDDAFYKGELHRWEVKHTSKKAELEEAEGMREAFLSVFDSEADLEAEPNLSTVPVQHAAPPAATVPAPAPAEPPPAVEPEEDMDLGTADDLVLDSIDDESASDISFDAALDETDEPLAVDDTADLMPEALDVDEDDVDEETPEDAAETVTDDIQLMPELPEDLDPIAPAEALSDDALDDDLVDDLSGEFEDDLDAALDDDELVDDLSDDAVLPPPLPGSTAKLPEMPPPPPFPGDKETLMMPVMGGMAAMEDEDGEPETMIIATPKIISMNNATEGQTIVLGMGTTSLGRSPENDIHITEDRISRKHSQITFGPGGYALYDLNSENGSFVNGQRIREHFLQDGDIIQVGTYKYLYRDH